MKLLQKILFVVIIGIFTENVAGLQFSDPRLPVPILAHNPPRRPAGDYVDFQVQGSNAHIYFPRNGILLAAHNVEQLACVNRNTGITNWYVRAFGGDVGVELSQGRATPGVDNAPQMGLAAAASAHIIIANMGVLNLNQQFWQAFRAIADTVAGRKLLYKILIEIRRIDTANHNLHCYVSGTERVGGMSLTVTHAADTAFVNKGSITFNQAHAGDLLNALQRYYSFLTTLVTLPANTPHLAVGTVTNIPNAATASDQFTHVQIPTPGRAAANADIYFPIDGHQPTTPNAVTWSCANVDNRENSPITEWYMMMFGVIPINHAAIAAAAGGPGPVPAPVFVQAGWDNLAVNPQQIISFDAGFDGASMVTYPESVISVSREDIFVQNFRKIASTSVGRVLLYRILIEVRRYVAGGNIGCLGGDIPGALPPARNSCRSIVINWDFRMFYFAAGHREIGINNCSVSLPSVGMDGLDVAGSYDGIITHKLPIEVSLFHEMNHWYHYLRHPNRYSDESNDHQTGVHINGVDTAVALVGLNAAALPAAAHVLGEYYWGNLGGWGNIDISEAKWQILIDNGAGIVERRVDFEELRNILGVGDAAMLGALGGVFYNGDDLSENLYRICISMPLRFGYVLSEYYEDSRVIDRVISCCNLWKRYYYFSPRIMSNVRFGYDNPQNRQGIGRCKIYP
jgi:hypothetical protein